MTNETYALLLGLAGLILLILALLFRLRPYLIEYHEYVANLGINFISISAGLWTFFYGITANDIKSDVDARQDYITNISYIMKADLSYRDDLMQKDRLQKKQMDNFCTMPREEITEKHLLALTFLAENMEYGRATEYPVLDNLKWKSSAFPNYIEQKALEILLKLQKRVSVFQKTHEKLTVEMRNRRDDIFRNSGNFDGKLSDKEFSQYRAIACSRTVLGWTILFETSPLSWMRGAICATGALLASNNNLEKEKILESIKDLLSISNGSTEQTAVKNKALKDIGVLKFADVQCSLYAKQLVSSENSSE